MEKEFVAKLAAEYADAEATDARGLAMREEGAVKIEEAEELLPKIKLTPPVMAYYHRRLELARTQLKMGKDFGYDYFNDTLRNAHDAKGSGKALSHESYERIIEVLLERERVAKAERDRAARERERAEKAAEAAQFEQLHGDDDDDDDSELDDDDDAASPGGERGDDEYDEVLKRPAGKGLAADRAAARARRREREADEGGADSSRKARPARKSTAKKPGKKPKK